MTLHTRSASPEAVRFHYDLGNAFYKLWLDSSMTYSCALFTDGEDGISLETAQMRKLDYHATLSSASGKQRVLDIGCGWGAMLNRLVSHHGVLHGVGLTLSEAQAFWIREGNDPRIEVRVENWHDHEPDQLYDAIVSIGAIEHFARPGLSEQEKIGVYRSFFERCHSWLGPGGRVSIQTIAYGNAGSEDLDEFIVTQIFPESDLPRLTEISAASERRFEILSVVNERDQYVKTLRAWLSRFRQRKAEAVNLVGEEAVSRYEQYLQLSIFMFASGNCDLLRIALRRIDHPRLSFKTKKP